MTAALTVATVTTTFRAMQRVIASVYYYRTVQAGPI
jgi:hypothetical protein